MRLRPILGRDHINLIQREAVVNERPHVRGPRLTGVLDRRIELVLAPLRDPRLGLRDEAVGTAVLGDGNGHLVIGHRGERRTLQPVARAPIRPVVSDAERHHARRAVREQHGRAGPHRSGDGQRTPADWHHVSLFQDEVDAHRHDMNPATVAARPVGQRPV